MSQLQRLEHLLAVVQENRQKPHLAVATSQAVSKAAATAPTSKVAPEPSAAVQPSAVVQPAPAAQAPSGVQTQTGHTASPSTAKMPAAKPSQPERLPLPQPEITGPVAEVIAQAPAIRDLTFGELLARTLALRPR